MQAAYFAGKQPKPTKEAIKAKEQREVIARNTKNRSEYRARTKGTHEVIDRTEVVKRYAPKPARVAGVLHFREKCGGKHNEIACEGTLDELVLVLKAYDVGCTCCKPKLVSASGEYRIDAKGALDLRLRRY